MSKLEVKDDKFFLDNKEIKIYSGAIHYFRTVPEYWEDRLLKLKACGFNTVETYVAWNLHEPEEGKFNFSDIADIERFVKTAGDLGLYVIVRPGPYICAEWDFGGFPGWLMNYPDIKLRTYNKTYLEKVDAFFDQLLPRLKPYLSTNGGPIIAMQVENEYGSYGCDKKYLNYLKEGMIKRGIDVFLFTSDGPTDMMIQGGSIKGLLETANFGSGPKGAFEKLREYEKGPLMCTEFWIGWFDHWGNKHHVRDPKDVADNLDEMLRLNGSVNFYMFHGGTNFGFYNGCNFDKQIMPTATTYDYDALLTEAGDITEKYRAVSEVLSKYTEVDKTIKVADTVKKSYGEVKLSEQIGLFDCLDKISQPVKCAHTLPMEKLEQYQGFILYRTKINGKKGKVTVNIKECHDRAMIFLNGIYQGVIDRTESDEKNRVVIDIDKEQSQLDILVENLGRINYGNQLGEFKGITDGVLLNYQYQSDWTMYSLPLIQPIDIDFNKEITDTSLPCFYKGTFEVDEKADTFVNMDGWTKGVVYINGHNLGRYWDKGPQKTLYVPAPYLKEGTNKIQIFELHKCNEAKVSFIDHHIFE